MYGRWDVRRGAWLRRAIGAARGAPSVADLVIRQKSKAKIGETALGDGRRMRRIGPA